METIVLLLGLIMILEGIPYFTAPETVKTVAEKIIATENRTLRLIGLALMMGGLLTVAWIRL
ncbi:MAG: DUF2065 domain-containing protein [Nitrospinae bacterium]|nr:DUF2065 domain-containing protein [Nitrospinota bacterium]